jgi:hypothetical protein
MITKIITKAESLAEVPWTKRTFNPVKFSFVSQLLRETQCEHSRFSQQNFSVNNYVFCNENSIKQESLGSEIYEIS